MYIIVYCNAITHVCYHLEMCRDTAKGSALGTVSVPTSAIPQRSQIGHLDCQPIRKAWSQNWGEYLYDYIRMYKHMHLLPFNCGFEYLIILFIHHLIL